MYQYIIYIYIYSNQSQPTPLKTAPCTYPNKRFKVDSSELLYFLSVLCEILIWV